MFSAVFCGVQIKRSHDRGSWLAGGGEPCNSATWHLARAIVAAPSEGLEAARSRQNTVVDRGRRFRKAEPMSVSRESHMPKVASSDDMRWRTVRLCGNTRAPRISGLRFPRYVVAHWGSFPRIS